MPARKADLAVAAWGGEMQVGESWKTGSEVKRQRMAIYLEWLLTPAEERQPATKQELAEQLGVSTQTLRNYARDGFFQHQLLEQTRSINRVERAADVMDSLYRQAIDGDNPRSVQAAKVWLDQISRLTDMVVPASVAELNDDELAALAVAMLQKLASR